MAPADSAAWEFTEQGFHEADVTSAIAAAVLVAAAMSAAAQKPAADTAYPSKSIRMIVPFAPGGGTDIIARLVAQDLTQSWGQSVVVDNRGGSGGLIGTELAAKAAPDGYTMVLVSLGFSYAPALYSKLPYDTEKDFLPISLVATQPFVYVVIPSLGVNSMKDLIATAKGKPGEIRYGSGGARRLLAPGHGALARDDRHRSHARAV